MKTSLRSLLIILGTVMPVVAFAMPSSITYQHDHHLFTIYPAGQGAWFEGDEIWLYEGVNAIPSFCTDCEEELPAGWTQSTQSGWNSSAIADSIREQIATELDRDAGSVVIEQTSSGTIIFTGTGMTGRKIDIDRTVDLTIAALENDVYHVILPVEETQPSMTIDPALEKLGIREVVTIGESVFAGSPPNRIHNIQTGLDKFNGTLVEQGAVFSFNEILGPVNASTGYLRELVILGSVTVPDYGGGLCQISSTAYRGVWEYGFPIVQRKNHSYTVSYYSPQGTDATIYPPHVDMKFENNSSGALLLQTYADMENGKAYYIYYGTKDNRQSEIFGPYVWSTRPAIPGTRTEKTTSIPPGTTRKVGSAVPGATTSWFRKITDTNGVEEVQEVYSVYEPRQLYYQVGVTAEELESESDRPATEAPSWLPSSADTNTESSSATDR